MKDNIFTTKLIEIIVAQSSDQEVWNSKTILKTPAIFIVMEFHKSDLRNMIEIQKSQKSFEDEHVLVVAYNLLCATKYLHTANVMHRDIKPSNIMVDEDCSVVLCDFGMSRTIRHE